MEYEQSVMSSKKVNAKDTYVRLKGGQCRKHSLRGSDVKSIQDKCHAVKWRKGEKARGCSGPMAQEETRAPVGKVKSIRQEENLFLGPFCRTSKAHLELHLIK